MIELNDNWRITADDRCYILEEFVVGKRTGVGKWTPQFYYSSIPSTLVGFRKNVKRAVVASEDKMTLDEFIKISHKLDAGFIDQIKDVCKQCMVWERDRG